MEIVASSRDPVPSPPRATQRWPDALKMAVRDPVQLCELLHLPATYHEPARQASRLFPLFAPLEYIGRMRPGDPHDALLRQVFPIAEELDDVPGYHADPVDDACATLRPGLLQKYPGRVLMVTTPTCAVHCRYCFRRHFDYDATPRTMDDWQPAFDQIADDPTIQEVVLSGGDPLMLPDRRLELLVERLESIPHLKRLRLHTRLPIVVPQRVTDRLVTLLRDAFDTGRGGPC